MNLIKKTTTTYYTNLLKDLINPHFRHLNILYIDIFKVGAKFSRYFNRLNKNIKIIYHIYYQKRNTIIVVFKRNHFCYPLSYQLRSYSYRISEISSFYTGQFI